MFYVVCFFLAYYINLRRYEVDSSGVSEEPAGIDIEQE